MVASPTAGALVGLDAAGARGEVTRLEGRVSIEVTRPPERVPPRGEPSGPSGGLGRAAAGAAAAPPGGTSDRPSSGGGSREVPGRVRVPELSLGVVLLRCLLFFPITEYVEVREAAREGQSTKG